MLHEGRRALASSWKAYAPFRYSVSLKMSSLVYTPQNFVGKPFFWGPRPGFCTALTGKTRQPSVVNVASEVEEKRPVHRATRSLQAQAMEGVPVVLAGWQSTPAAAWTVQGA